MDFSKLQDQVSNLTLYDLKAGVRKMQNGMLSSLMYIRVAIPSDLRLSRNSPKPG
jgi:hypothetical protein